MLTIVYTCRSIVCTLMHVGMLSVIHIVCYFFLLGMSVVGPLVTSQVIKNTTMNANCPPSYQVHCIATTTPSGSLQPVDLSNAVSFSLWRAVIVFCKQRPYMWRCYNSASWLHRLGLCLVCRRSQDQTWQVSAFFLSVKCTFPTGIFFSYVFTPSMHPWAYICYLGIHYLGCNYSWKKIHTNWVKKNFNRSQPLNMLD